MSLTEKPRSKALRYGLIMVCALMLLAVLIPNSFKYSAFAKQDEAKINLKSLFLAQAEYFSRYRTFASHTANKDCFQLLDWHPQRILLGPPNPFEILEWWRSENRYSYFCDRAVIQAVRPIGHCNIKPPEPAVSATSFTIYAVGNIDNDDHCDVWSINDAKILRNLESDVQQ